MKMDKKRFERTDEKLSKKLRDAAPRMPEGILKGFSLSVTEKIRERQNTEILFYQRSPALRFRVLVPAFAAALLFFTVIFRTPGLHTDPGMRTLVSLSAADIVEEISTLKSIDAWSDEDDKAVVPPEAVFEEVA